MRSATPDNYEGRQSRPGPKGEAIEAFATPRSLPGGERLGQIRTIDQPFLIQEELNSLEPHCTPPNTGPNMSWS